MKSRSGTFGLLLSDSCRLYLRRNEDDQHIFFMRRTKNRIGIGKVLYEDGRR